MEYVFRNVEPSELRAYHDLNAQADTYEQLWQRVESGQLSYRNLYVLKSGRGVEAAFALGKAPVLVLRARHDLPGAGQQVLAAQLETLEEVGRKTLILDSRLCSLDAEVFLRRGWSLESDSVLYTTDLKAQHHAPDPAVIERPVTDLLSPELRRLYVHLLQADPTIGDTGTADPQAALGDAVNDGGQRLFVVPDGAGEVIAAATLGLGPRGEASIHMVGVTPERRGQGLGARLHAHLLHEAASVSSTHMGGTDAANTAMIRIFERNGALQQSRQRQFRQA